MVELADLRAAATLGTGKEVKSGVCLQIVSLVPKILEKIESKDFIFSSHPDTCHHVQHQWG